MSAPPVLPPTTVPTAPGPPRAAPSSRTPALTAWAVVALSGLLSAAVIPRGPVTGVQVIALMTTAALAGGLTGWCVRSRRAVVGAPVLHVAVWEIARATVFRLD